MTDRRIGMTVEFTNKYGKVVQHKIDKLVALRGGGKAIEIWQDGRKTLLPITGDLKIFSSDDLTTPEATTSVAPVSNDNTEVTEMRTYAEYLNSLTVKTLNVIAKRAGLKGYSKLRKAGLILVIDVAVTTAHIEAARIHAEITPSIEAQVDDLFETLFAAELNAPREIIDARHMELINDGMHFIRHEAAIMDTPEVAALHRKLAAQKPAAATFSSTPTSPKVTLVKPAPSAPESVSIMETVEAYRSMRKTVNSLGNVPLRVRLVARLRTMSAEIKAAGMNPALI